MKNRTIPGISRFRVARHVLPLVLLVAPAWEAVPGALAAGEAELGLRHWVPVSQAFADGEVEKEHFTPEELAQIEPWLETPEPPEAPEGAVKEKKRSPEDCDVLLVTSAGIESPDVSEALSAARLALTGTVISMEAGLYRGRLATLVAVEVDRWLTVPDEISPRPVVHFIYGNTRTMIGDRSYCQRTAGREDRLAVGRRLVVATSNVLEDEPLVLLPYESELFFETDRGSVSAAGPLRGGAPADWPGFEELVARLAKEEGV